VSSLAHKFSVLHDRITESWNVSKEFGLEFGFINFISDVVFAHDKTYLGRKLNKIKYDIIEKWMMRQFPEVIERYKNYNDIQNIGGGVHRYLYFGGKVLTMLLTL